MTDKPDQQKGDGNEHTRISAAARVETAEGRRRSEMTMPGFTAEATLKCSSKHYRITTRPSNNQGVIAQIRACGFQAGRLMGRCLAGGNNQQDCAEIAWAYIEFCNAADLPAGNFDVPDSGQH
jgi:hypothetical protein